MLQNILCARGAACCKMCNHKQAPLGPLGVSLWCTMHSTHSEDLPRYEGCPPTIRTRPVCLAVRPSVSEKWEEGKHMVLVEMPARQVPSTLTERNPPTPIELSIRMVESRACVHTGRLNDALVACTFQKMMVATAPQTCHLEPSIVGGSAKKCMRRIRLAGDITLKSSKFAGAPLCGSTDLRSEQLSRGTEFEARYMHSLCVGPNRHRRPVQYR